MNLKWFLETVVDEKKYACRDIWPKISIITPSFNQGKFLEETILSVLNQNYPNLEYIIIDGGSTDNSVEIIKKYENSLSYWVSEKDMGQTHAINKGFAICSGEIFNWLNSDDFLEENALFYIAKAFLDFNASAVLANYYWYYEIENRKAEHRTLITENNFAKTAAYSPNHQPGTFFKKILLNEIFPLNENLHYVMDQEMWIRFLIKNETKNLVYLDEFVSNLRQHSETKTEMFAPIFNIEYNAIYSNLAKAVNSSHKLKIILRFVPDSNNVKLNFSFSENERNAVNKIIDYYIYKILHNYFPRVDKYFEIKKILKFINIDNLNEIDKDVVRQLRKRRYFLLYLFYNQIIKK